MVIHSMAKAKKKAKTYNTYAAGGKVNPMTFDQVKENLKNGTLKLAKKSFAYGGKMYKQGGKPDYIDIDGDGKQDRSSHVHTSGMVCV